MASSRDWVRRAVGWCVMALLSGFLSAPSVLAARPTAAPAPLRLAQTGVDALRGELWALVENVSARPVAAGVEWRLWADADLYGRSVISSGALPALEPEGTYLLTLAAPKPDSVYRLQLLFHAAHGYTGSVWSGEIIVAAVAEATPTSAPTDTPLALVALPLLVAPVTTPPPVQRLATAAPEVRALPTAEQHRVLVPAVAQPLATLAPTLQPSVTATMPDPIAQLAVGALAVLLVVGAIVIVRRIAQDEDLSPPSGPK